MAHLVKTGVLTITGLPQKELEAIKRGLEIPDPTYQMAIKRNPRSRYYLSPVKKYYVQRKDSTLVIPVGVQWRVQDYLQRSRIGFTVDDQTSRRPVQFANRILERDYQIGIVEALRDAGGGVARLDTGFGKTLIALKLASLLGQRTLIIVPTIDLLNQFIYEAKKWTDASVSRLGSSANIVVETIQTLQRRLFHDHEAVGESFGCVIADECHRYVSEKAWQVFSQLGCAYRYGFTATARRTDGQGEAIGFLFGPTVVERKIPRAVPQVNVVSFEGKIAYGEYHEIIESQSKNRERNEKIVTIVRELVHSKRKILVLTKRIEHYETLRTSLSRSIDASRIVSIDSDNGRKERQEKLHALRNQIDSYDVLLGTFSLLSTGLDIPSLDTLVIAGDLKSDVLAEQSAGRVLRLLQGKSSPLIVDVWDSKHDILRRQGRERRKFYESQGWKIIN
jgi:superfamily II DNA or RNA helicase